MLQETVKEMELDDYILPDSKKKLSLGGPDEFRKDLQKMLDIIVHSSTALKILNHNASLEKPLIIEEFKEALDLGRNTGTSIQLAYKKLKSGETRSIYDWLTLIPHEFRHSYNAKIENSYILRAVAYPTVNEADAQAIGGLVGMELAEYIKNNKEKVTDADAILKYFDNDHGFQFFKSFYDKTSGTEEQRKAEAMTTFVKEFSKRYSEREKKTFAEIGYKNSIERNTTKDGGWERCSDEEFKKIEACLLGKVDPKTVAHEDWMKGRKKLFKEKEITPKRWYAFCEEIMNGTFNTDVIKYGQGLNPENLIETLAPKLAEHLREIGVMPNDTSANTASSNAAPVISQALKNSGR